jgi:uncharacterized protein YndB with AHSA1/START domain
MTAGSRPRDELDLRIERIIPLPIEDVFELWTKPEHFKHWWGPKDEQGRPFSLAFHEADIREGGAWRACIRAPDGREYWQNGRYETIAPPHRLVFTFNWENDEEPVEMLIEVEFVAQGQSTLMKFRQSRFLSEASRDGHTEGWQECFDRLVDYAEAQRSK